MPPLVHYLWRFDNENIAIFIINREQYFVMGFDLIDSFSKFSNVHFSREILAWFIPLHVLSM